MTMQDDQALEASDTLNTPSLGSVLLVEDNLRVSDELCHALRL